jgi:hypothetical protein
MAAVGNDERSSAAERGVVLDIDVVVDEREIAVQRRRAAGLERQEELLAT